MFLRQNYNEFKDGVRWHDYFSFIVNEFSIVLVRKYDWPFGDNRTYVFLIDIFGFTVYKRIGSHE